MKKRGVLAVLIVLVLLFLPAVSAKIVILNNFKDIYNIGDTVTVEGYVVAEKTADAAFSLEMNCPSYSKVNSVNLKINKGQKLTFTTMGISSFVLPIDVEGRCTVEAAFNGESAISDSFTVLNDLLGTFDVAQDEYQLGQSLSVSGIVFKLDGSDVSGTATIFLKKEGSYAVQFDTATVTNGLFEYSKQLSNLEFGSYSLDIKVLDSAGNSQYFESVDSFKISTDLNVRATTTKYQYEPGEEVVVSGEIETSADTSTLDVTITLDTLKYTTTPTGKNFEYRFFVPKNMKSGDYSLTVNVQDNYGNRGSDEFVLTVKQIPTTIENDIPTTKYNPGDILEFEINLYDQSDKTMSGDISVEITDPSGAKLYDGVVNTGQTIELEFGKYSAPGTYKITSQYSAKNLEDSDTVTVAEVKQISSELSGEILKIKNVGNVGYSDRVDLILVTEENGEKKYYVIAKDVLLEPGQEYEYDLSYEVPEGTYSIIVDDGTTDISGFEDDEIADYVTGMVPAYSDIPFGEDNRALTKKVDQGLSSITGASAISTYDRSITPWFLVLILFIFGGLLGLYGYQHRTVIQGAYVNYKKKMTERAEEEGGFLSTMTHKGSYDAEKESTGDISPEEVAKLLAASETNSVISKSVETKPNLNDGKMQIPTKQSIKPSSTVTFDTQKREITGNRFSTMGKSATVQQ
ncbi:MAG: hypothetical protein WC254_05425, partial [Candidatus Woesearchaeota archaeon]